VVVFFDRVNHDKLMAKLAQRVGDKRMLKLIRAFLTAGVLEGGLVMAVDEGTPQGGPLSPLLSNIVLDELDQELERRGLRFVRYADDSNIYVRSQRAGERVMESVTRFITKQLKLKVNSEKSAVARPWQRKFLGFSFTSAGVPKRRIAPQAVDRFKERVRTLTCRTRSVSIERMAEQLAQYLRGWIGYFGYCQTPSILQILEEWTRHRLRSVIWKQWKRGTRRFAELVLRGVDRQLSANTAASKRGPWRVANSPALYLALPNAYLDSLGIPRLTASALLNSPNRRMRTRMSGGVGGQEL
jgi:RNA-directed DNA polymerase